MFYLWNFRPPPCAVLLVINTNTILNQTQLQKASQRSSPSQPAPDSPPGASPHASGRSPATRRAPTRGAGDRPRGAPPPPRKLDGKCSNTPKTNGKSWKSDNLLEKHIIELPAWKDWFYLFGCSKSWKHWLNLDFSWWVWGCTWFNNETRRCWWGLLGNEPWKRELWHGF